MGQTSTPVSFGSKGLFFISFLLFFSILSSSLAQTNLVTNGNFSAGNTGFMSEYVYSTNLQPEGNYYVGDNPKNYHGSFCKMDDESLRSPGSPIGSRGNMLIGNASGDASIKLWSQTIPVTKNTNYTFSFYASSLAGSASSLMFGLYVNCKRTGADVTATSNCGWTKYTFQFNSGNLTSVELSIRNMSLQRSGNDIAIDDIEFYKETPTTPYSSLYSFVWKGYNTDWFNADNWGACTTPTCDDHVIIPGGVANYPVIKTGSGQSSVTAYTGNITIQSGASLSINANATLSVCGNFVNEGSLTMNNQGMIILAGSSNQEIAHAGTFANLQINQSVKGVVTAQSNINVAGELTLTRGLLNANGYEIILSNSAPTAITVHSSQSYVVGNLRRAVSGIGNYDFPVGDASRYELMRMYITTSLGTDVANVLGYFNAGNVAGTAGLPLTEEGNEYRYLSTGGFWHITPNGTPASAARYDLEVFPSNIVTNDVNTTLIKRTNSTSSWSMGGSTPASGNPNRRNGYSTFSEVAIVSGGPVALPVQMLSFQAAQKNGDVQWSTAQEHNSDYFVVEKSSDAKNFTEIGRVTAAGESKTLTDYTYADTRTQAGISYYRLHQVDQDGYSTYSKVISADIKSSEAQVFSLYPNPSSGQNIYLLTEYVGTAQILLLNHFGKVLSRQQITTNGRPVSIGQEIDIPQGVYIVKLTTPEKEYQQKLVIR
jgi:hypothetical protein